MSGKFTHINEAFTCEFCQKHVPASTVGCRNHCPFCLSSKHVDQFPGDRLNPCLGLMKAVGYELDPKKGVVLLFKCGKCGADTRNKANHQDPVCPDDYDLILTLNKQRFKR